MVSHFLKTNFSLSHLLISIIIDIFNFLRCFIDIVLHKYKFHNEKVFSVNWTYVTKFVSDGIYCKNRYKKAYCNRQGISFRKKSQFDNSWSLNLFRRMFLLIDYCPFYDILHTFISWIHCFLFCVHSISRSRDNFGDTGVPMALKGKRPAWYLWNWRVKGLLDIFETEG